MRVQSVSQISPAGSAIALVTHQPTYSNLKVILMTDIHYEEAYTVLAEQFRSSLKSLLRDVGKLEGGRQLIKRNGIDERFEAVERLRIKKLARELFDYMQYRIGIEQEYMPPSSYPDETDSYFFYYEFLLGGGREFFGVEIGEHTLIRDMDSPKAFHTWKAKIDNQSEMKSVVGATAADRPKLHSAPVRAKAPGVKLRLVGEGADSPDKADGSARGGAAGLRQQD